MTDWKERYQALKQLFAGVLYYMGDEVTITEDDMRMATVIPVRIKILIRRREGKQTITMKLSSR